MRDDLGQNLEGRFFPRRSGQARNGRIGFGFIAIALAGLIWLHQGISARAAQGSVTEAASEAPAQPTTAQNGAAAQGVPQSSSNSAPERAREKGASGGARRAGPAISEGNLPMPTGGSIEVSPFDVLKILVFGVPSLSGDYPVDQSGVIKMPLLGELSVAGQSPLEVAAFLEEKLGERYLQNADVSVTITGGGASAVITVDGSVRSPGLYPVRGRLTLLQVIALSGGPAEDANQNRILVFRTIDGRRHAAKFNLRDIRAGVADDPLLFGNDVVIVDGRATSKVYQRILRTLPLFSVFTGL